MDKLDESIEDNLMINKEDVLDHDEEEPYENPLIMSNKRNKILIAYEQWTFFYQIAVFFTVVGNLCWIGWFINLFVVGFDDTMFKELEIFGIGV